MRLARSALKANGLIEPAPDIASPRNSAAKIGPPQGALRYVANAAGGINGGGGWHGRGCRAHPTRAAAFSLTRCQPGLAPGIKAMPTCADPSVRRGLFPSAAARWITLQGPRSRPGPVRFVDIDARITIPLPWRHQLPRAMEAMRGLGADGRVIKEFGRVESLPLGGTGWL